MAYNIISSNPFAVLEGSEEGATSAAPARANVARQTASLPEEQRKTVASQDRGRGYRNERKSKQETRGPSNKRVFDRHSGTGRGVEVKKGGAGKFNWGKDTSQAEEKPEAQSEEAVSGTEKDAPVEAPATDAAPVEEPEAKELEYDDYVKMLQAKAPKVGPLVERRVQDDDAGQWKSAERFERQPEKLSPFEVPMQKAKGKDSKSKKVKEGVVTADVPFRFADATRFGDRPARGGRGGGRGDRFGDRRDGSSPRRGRGGQRGPPAASTAAAPGFSVAVDFPALS